VPAREGHHIDITREDIVALCDREVLGKAARLFGTSKEALRTYASYEGCANLVYDYERDGRPLILRISYHPDRPMEQIAAELHFVNYLGDHGVRVSRPVRSLQGNLIEPVSAGGIQFLAVSFVKGKGMRVPDNDYRYREGVPIEEYFQNWGHVLGQMHALAKDYQPLPGHERRPLWHEEERLKKVDQLVPEWLPVVRARFQSLLAQIRSLPQDRDSFGLIHGDFNDGNFTVDYDNGDITVFDFDDACYGHYVYELACAWEGGVGRAMFQPLAERRAFMEHYFDQVLQGYERANQLSAEWLQRLPLFLRLVQMQEFLHYAPYIEGLDEEMPGHMKYKIHCIENDVAYLGFFDSSYSPSEPFSL
jgi:Ser/Thr protein kinase RdoA (MazF antagonist)